MGGRRGRGAWHVLGFRDFRLIALGNADLQLGFWAQYVGVGWAARSLTDSSFLITVAFRRSSSPRCSCPRWPACWRTATTAAG